MGTDPAQRTQPAADLAQTPAQDLSVNQTGWRTVIVRSFPGRTGGQAMGSTFEQAGTLLAAPG